MTAVSIDFGVELFGLAASIDEGRKRERIGSAGGYL
jgi:hypothetical protein